MNGPVLSRGLSRVAGGTLALLLGASGVVGAQRVTKEPPPSDATGRVHWAVVLNNDTLAVETVTRTPRRLDGDLRLLRPRAMAVQYALFLRPDGAVDSLQTTTVDASAVARGTIAIRPDSAVLTMVAPGLTEPRVDRVAVLPGTLPFINLSAGVLDQILRRARSSGRDTVTIPLLAGPQLMSGRIRFTSRDSAVVDIGVELRAAVAADGALLGAVVPSQGVRFVRTAASLRPGGTAADPYAAPAGAPYTAAPVTIRTADGARLVGTLTLPAWASASRPAPVVVTISGSGPQSRDGEVLGVTGYRIFGQIADTLGRRGVGVLRLDDRGAGESDASAAGATTASLADDVRTALAWLRRRPEVDGTALGLLGHSEGGLIAPMVAGEDSLVRAVALLAAPSRPGHEVSAHQRRTAIARDPRVPPAARDSVFRTTQAQADSLLRAGGGDPWMRFWWSYDPRPPLRALRVPVLLLHGETDAQVPVAHADEAGALLRAGGNADVTVVRVPGVNHLLLEDADGFWGGYATLPSVRVPAGVTGIIADWFASRLGTRR